MIELVSPAGLRPQLEAAFEFAQQQVRRLAERDPDFYPMYTRQGRWRHSGEAWTHWCDGFLPGNQTLTIGGTSMAAPHMAGIMALLRELHPTWEVNKLKALAIFSSDAISSSAYASDEIIHVRPDIARFTKLGGIRFDKGDADQLRC